MSKSIAFSFALMALIAPLCINWIEAQKTAANSFQKQIGGSGPNSVYGGYQTSSSAVQRRQQQQQTALVSPVQQSQRTSYSQSSESYRQPAYQQQQQLVSSSSSYESNQQQAEADAEPASYGKLCFKVSLIA